MLLNSLFLVLLQGYTIMHNQHRINVKNITDIPLCQQMLTDYLAFHQVNVTALNPLFKGSICVDTFTSLPFIQAVKLDMFTHTTHFIHADCASHCQQHCVLIHSLSSLIVNAKRKISIFLQVVICSFPLGSLSR